MIPGRSFFSTLQWKSNCDKATCLELFQGIEQFEPTFMEAHCPSHLIAQVGLLQSQIKTHSLLEDITHSRNEVSTDFESNITVGI